MKNHPTRLRIVSLILCICMIAAGLAACGEKKPTAPELKGAKLSHEPEFGGVYIELSIEEFNKLGFNYGDSVDISFSNGVTLEGLPYYNGYYTLNGQPLLVAYPGYPYIKACINSGADLWTVSGLSDTDTADIKLNTAGAFLDIQQARDIHYQDDRSKFPTDAVFANFRNIKAGNIKEGRIYRSASPCDNQHQRAPYVDELIAIAGVRYIVDLADTNEKMQGYIEADGFSSDYWLSLFKDNKVYPAAMNMNFGSEEFRAKAAGALAAMVQNRGPYLVHCTEGKDRTGFVCMLIEALCGASYQEIVDDYMITYDNYYQINLTDDSARYNTIVEYVLDPMIQDMAGPDCRDIKTEDLSVYAEAFLLSGGMSLEQIQSLKHILTAE